jgi:hypothetical protein
MFTGANTKRAQFVKHNHRVSNYTIFASVTIKAVFRAEFVDWFLISYKNSHEQLQFIITVK